MDEAVERAHAVVGLELKVDGVVVAGFEGVEGELDAVSLGGVENAGEGMVEDGVDGEVEGGGDVVADLEDGEVWLAEDEEEAVGLDGAGDVDGFASAAFEVDDDFGSAH
jgi:hypothetical protein